MFQTKDNEELYKILKRNTSCLESKKFKKQRLCDSTKPLSRPLSTNGENWEQYQTFPGVLRWPRVHRWPIQDYAEHHLMYWRTDLSQLGSVFMTQQKEEAGHKTESMRTIQSKLPYWWKRLQMLISHLPRSILVIPKIFWEMWTEETKLEICGRCELCYNCRKINTAFDKEEHIFTLIIVA